MCGMIADDDEATENKNLVVKTTTTIEDNNIVPEYGTEDASGADLKANLIKHDNEELTILGYLRPPRPLHTACRNTFDSTTQCLVIPGCGWSWGSTCDSNRLRAPVNILQSYTEPLDLWALVSSWFWS